MNELDERMRERIAMQLRAQAVLEASGWFQHGVMMLERLREANITDGQLCWFIPAGTLAKEVLKGATLWGLPVYEATAGTPPGIGIPLPVCSSKRGCPAHVEPPRQVEHLWTRWAQQHGVPVG